MFEAVVPVPVAAVADVDDDPAAVVDKPDVLVLDGFVEVAEG